jgi:hypothetical protein
MMKRLSSWALDMSINSKAKRDARKKRMRTTPASSIPKSEVHARLYENDALVGGGALHQGEWVMTLKGQAMSGTNSPAMLLSMLKRAASALEEQGSAVHLEYSTKLRDAATSEATEGGKTLDELLKCLEDERKERSQPASLA